MTHSRHSFALAVVVGAASITGCSKGASADAAAPSPREATPLVVSAAEATTPQVDTATVDVPRVVASDAKATTAATGAAMQNSPVSTPAREPARVADMREPYTHLSAGEARYFDGKFLDQGTLDKAMRSRDFDSSVLDLQSGGDVEAMARRHAYTEAFRKSLLPYADRARLGNIGCGTVLCMGSLRTASKEWIGPWTIELHNQPLPLPSLAIRTIRLGSEYEVRFSFTTTGAGGFATKR